jgi:hypothetical protein
LPDSLLNWLPSARERVTDARDGLMSGQHEDPPWDQWLNHSNTSP